MFQFTRCPPRALCVQARVPRHYPRRVSPFGNPRIIAFVLLPEAYRCLHVLRRQLVPRHSSHTLCSLNIFFSALHSVPLTRAPRPSIRLSKRSRRSGRAFGPSGPSAKRDYTPTVLACQPAPSDCRKIGTLGTPRRFPRQNRHGRHRVQAPGPVPRSWVPRPAT